MIKSDIAVLLYLSIIFVLSTYCGPFIFFLLFLFFAMQCLLWGKEIQTLLYSKAFACVYNIFFMVCNCKSLWVKKKLFNKSSLQAPQCQSFKLSLGSDEELRGSKTQSNSISNVRTKQQHLNIMGNLLRQTTKCKKSQFFSLHFSCQAWLCSVLSIFKTAWRQNRVCVHICVSLSW